jgi:hypothetical protein
VRDRRERRWCRGALRRRVGLGDGHDATHGPRQPPASATRRSASRGPHEPGA